MKFVNSVATAVGVLAAITGQVNASLAAKRSFVDVCANLNGGLEISGLLFGNIDVCLCLSNVGAFVSTNLVASLAAGVLGEAKVVAALDADITSAGGVSCTYPDNSTPNCGKSCGWACTPPYVKQGSSCVLQPSHRKRSPAEIARSLHKCDYGLTKCGVTSASTSSSLFSESKYPPYECLDTTNNLESCGGCVVPYPLLEDDDEDRTMGMDCTALPGTVDVQCRRGTCIARECAAGYVLVNAMRKGQEVLECVPHFGSSAPSANESKMGSGELHNQVGGTLVWKKKKSDY